MQLWSSTTSPFARKARVCVIEKGLSDQVEDVYVKTNAIQSDPKLRELNPLGKIPCLFNDEGHALFDSRVICKYLDEHGTGTVLHPSGHYKHETLLALADGMIDAGALMIYETMLRPENKQYQPWVEGQWSKVQAALELADRDFMDMMAHFSMAAITVLCAVEYIDFRFDERNWRQYAPNLAAWHAENKDRDSFVATRPSI